MMDDKGKLGYILQNIDTRGVSHLVRKLNITREEFARNAGICVETIRKWYNKSGGIGESSREKIAHVYGRFILQDTFFKRYLVYD